MKSVLPNASAGVLLPLLLAVRLEAQPPAPSPVSRCSTGGAIARLAAGSVVGGWLGFVAAKIRVSDWDDNSGGAAAQRMRTRATIGGAAIGAAVTGILLHTKSCTVANRGIPIPRAGFEPITLEEIQKSGLNGNVYDLVYSRRRSWLNLRGVDTFTEGTITWTIEGRDYVFKGEPRLIVYLDEAKYGSAEQLRELSIMNVTEVRYYDGATATQKWGAGHMHGVIQVITTPQP